jgi:GntR family transcriptional regulator
MTSSSADYLIARRTRTGDAWAREAGSVGRTGSQRISEVATVAATAEVAQALQMLEGDPVVVRRREILLDGLPVELADSYYPAAIADGTALARPDKIPGGAVTLLAEQGHDVAVAVEEVGARPATAAEEASLTVQDGWVIVLTRLSLDRVGRPVEYAVNVCPASQRKYRYEVRVN